MFTLNGKTHYGWARLSVQASKDRFTLTATLTGYAYETIPGKSIVAGKTGPVNDGDENDFGPDASLTNPLTSQPASLGMLALGSTGLSIWRHREFEVEALERN
jgi:hypothetical protein